MSDVLTPKEVKFVSALRDAPILGDGMGPAACHDAARLINRLAAEVARLRDSSASAFACPRCNAEVAADEDGCCVTCGGDAIPVVGTPRERENQRHIVAAMIECAADDARSESAGEIIRLLERNERLEAVALAEHEEFSLLHFETSSFHSQALRAAGLRIHAVRNHVVAQQEPKP